jgi:hypothetical protein
LKLKSVAGNPLFNFVTKKLRADAIKLNALELGPTFSSFGRRFWHLSDVGNNASQAVLE